MTKTIDTVTQDVLEMLSQDGSHLITDFIGKDLPSQIQYAVSKSKAESKPRTRDKLWPSELGETCELRLWNERHNHTAKEETILNSDNMKFLYGDILETVLLDLVKASGHSVHSRQAPYINHIVSREVNLSGRIDAVIDDHIVDVKVVSNKSFEKFQSNEILTDDPFGYIAQLEAYYGFNKYILMDKSTDIEGAAFLVLNKVSGDLLLWKYPYGNQAAEINTRMRVDRLARVINDVDGDLIKQKEQPIPYGTSGNMVLNMKCSYCPYKKNCYAFSNGGHGLKAFQYKQGKVYFTEIKRTPLVPEVPV